MQESDIQEIVTKLSTSQSVYVVVGSEPTIDMVASSIALAETLKASGKKVHLLCPTPMIVEFSNLYGIDTVSNVIGNKDLVISLPYEANQVEKVSYTISEDGTRFNLVISPASNSTPLNFSQAEFAYSGAQADIAFMIGTESTDDLKQLYEQEQQFFDGVFSVVINYQKTKMLCRHELLIGSYSSFSEGMNTIIKRLQLEITPELATNLLVGIEHETKQFTTQETTAETFACVAELMRLGGERKPITGSPSDRANSSEMAQGWFQSRTEPTYQRPSQQVSTTDFATMLKHSSSSATPPVPSIEFSTPLDNEFFDEDELDEQANVDEMIDDLKPTTPMSQVTSDPSIAMKISRGRKAAAAKKRKLQDAQPDQPDAHSINQLQTGSFAPRRQ